MSVAYVYCVSAGLSDLINYYGLLCLFGEIDCFGNVDGPATVDAIQVACRVHHRQFTL